jgi:hypothetical protein
MPGVTSINATWPVRSSVNRRQKLYRLPYLIETDGITDEAVVRAAFEATVPFNSIYGGDNAAVLQGHELTQNGETRDQWFGEAIFAVDLPDQAVENPDKVPLNLPPWSYPAVRSFSSVKRQRPMLRASLIDRDLWHQARALVFTESKSNKVSVSIPDYEVVNAAGVPYDPPYMEEVTHRIINFSISYQTWNELTIRRLIDAINTDDLGTLDGITVYPKYSLKCLAADAEEQVDGWGRWYKARLSFEFNPELWVIELNNVGLTELVYTDDTTWNGSPLIPPGFFDGDGTKTIKRPIKANEPQPLDRYGRRVKTDIKGNVDLYAASADRVMPYLPMKRAAFGSVFGPLPWDNTLGV